MLALRGTLLLGAALVAQTPPARVDLAIHHVRVVHGDGRVTVEATVLVDGGRIRGIVTGRPAALAARRIEGAGRTLIPGLIDAHVHLDSWALPVFLAHGVTTVRDLHNDPAFTLPLARADQVGRPRVIAAGAMLDTPESRTPHAIGIDDVADVRAAVREQIAAGAGVVVVSARLRPAFVTVAAQESRARGVPLAVHPGRTSAVEAAVAGAASLEHVGAIAGAVAPRGRTPAAADAYGPGRWASLEREWQLASPGDLDRAARRLVARGVTLVPALARYEAIARLTEDARSSSPAWRHVPAELLDDAWDPETVMKRQGWTPATLAGISRTLPAMQGFLAAYRRLGGAIAAGTDGGRPFVVPGASLHRELELYVAAGLSPAEALRTATVDAAGLLGIADRAGRIEEGLEADLVLIDGDPLSDITAVRRIRAVIQEGVEVER